MLRRPRVGASGGRDGKVCSLNSEPWLLASIWKEASDWLAVSLAYQEEVTVILDALAKSICFNRYIFPHTHDRRFLIVP